MLPIATAQDGNNEILSIAFAIVEGETKEAWEYFLYFIRMYVTNKVGLCLIFDRHQSIISAVGEMIGWQPPNAYHVFCIRHVASNFNTRFKDKELKRKFIRLGNILQLMCLDIHCLIITTLHCHVSLSFLQDMFQAK